MSNVAPHVQGETQHSPQRQNSSPVSGQNQSSFAPRAYVNPDQLTPADIPGLQRMVGNRAVQRLFAGRRSQGNSAPPRPMIVQPKVKVDRTRERHEEGDGIPRQIMRSRELSQRNMPRVQRLFDKKPKLPISDKSIFDTGQAPNNTLLTVSAAVKMGTQIRGTGSLRTLLAGGPGHSWLIIRLGPAFPTLKALAADEDGDMIMSVMEGPTKRELRKNKRTTIGFYPDMRGSPTAPRKLVKQISKDLPGQIIEPEDAAFASLERGAQTFAVTHAADAISLLNFIRSYRAKPYNVYRNNCTDFVVKAIQQIGYSMGKVSSASITLPTLLYKQIYSRAELGDRSATFTNLENKTNKAGKKYDVQHLGKKAQKKRNKQKAKAAPMFAARAKQELDAKIIESYTVPAFMTLRKGGMTRPNQTVLGVTGNVEDRWGEVVIEGTLDAIDLNEFEKAFGFPYPTKKADEGKPIEQDLIDQLNDIDADDIDDDEVDEEDNEVFGRGMVEI